MAILYSHRRLVSDSLTLVPGLEEKVKAKHKLTVLDGDILSWTEQMNWLRLKLEAVQEERAKLVTSDLGSVEQDLYEVASTGLERFEATMQLEAEVSN